MTSSPFPTVAPLSWGAAQIARAIAAKQISAREVCQMFIAQIEQVDSRLNAVVVRRFEEAQREAEALDEQQVCGESIGPLHGVPFTVKECFHVQGTPATIGLSARKAERSTEDGVLVRRLRRAGGICLGKTNVPQLMLLHECDNPVYGRTNNPWNDARTCGGSTGGEAAIIAAGGSPLGLGNDLGGSIRIPAHFCGIAGLKPTTRRLPRDGAVANFRGMTALQSQPGPLARRVEDLELGMQVLTTAADDECFAEVPPLPWKSSADVSIQGMRIGYWQDDGIFPASPAIQRVVDEAAEALQMLGAVLVPVKPPFVEELIAGYLGLMAADGGADPRRLAEGSTLDWRVSRMLMLERLSSVPRSLLVAGLQMASQTTMARLVEQARPLSANQEWQIARNVAQRTQQFLDWMQREQFSALLCPPHALPAPPHRFAIDLVAAASYAFLPNVLGFPAGVVFRSTVRPDETTSRPAARDLAHHRARQTDDRSEGMPVGVQVIAAPWREDIVLAVLRALEDQRPTGTPTTGFPDDSGPSPLVAATIK